MSRPIKMSDAEIGQRITLLPKWKLESHYHRRSLSETAMFRFKQIFTDKLQSRKQENQFQEMIIKCAALNRMTHLGMPDSYLVSI